MSSIAQICSVEGCGKKLYAKEYCTSHYKKLRLANLPPRSFCKIEGCDRRYSANGYCSMHLKRVKLYNDPYHERRRNGICEIEECDRKAEARGLCGLHSRRLKKYGDPLYVPEKVIKLCSVEGCENQHKSKGYCIKHRYRVKKYGDPSVARRREIHGMTKSLEYQTWWSMYGRCLNKNSPKYEKYGARGIKICQRWLNSFNDFLADMGAKPTGNERYSIDRIDNDGNYSCGKCEQCVENGWPMNCRWATDMEQSHNKGVSKKNTSEVSGVHFSSASKAWIARIGVGWERIYLGIFRDKDDAIKARKEAEIKYWGKT